MNKITELRQQSSEFKDELAQVTKELELNLVMPRGITFLTDQFHLRGSQVMA